MSKTKQLKDKGMSNPWFQDMVLNRGWSEGINPHEAKSKEELIKYLNGSDMIGSAVFYKDVAFFNQVNGGKEYRTFKWDGKGWVGFESLTWSWMDDDKKADVIDRILSASLEECVSLNY